ncbi:MAG TPA: [FeFe] hydrogenase H-cluster maturation GTPase HydF [Peptococcaceae bacterium]|nr:[FeFe] hydrogenase H-cluster maturation GTPase HydF [Peptococcaceae bacterium]
MDNLNATPLANRFTIGIFGRRNVGKSSLLNALTGQNIAVTSEVAGTTTDPVSKAMELLPLGPVVLFDTAGLDDIGELGMLRIEKTYEVLRKCNLALVVADMERGITGFETDFIEELKRRKIPCICVLNKWDKRLHDTKVLEQVRQAVNIPLVCTSAVNDIGIDELKQQIIANANREDIEPPLVGDLIKTGDIVVLVTPIDKSAPKGRLILPQQQTIRAIIDCNAIALVTKENELKLTLESLKKRPAMVITDSQAFHKVASDTPPEIPLTSFSILFARQKGDLVEMVRGIKRLERLKEEDKVLIVEGCTHHRQEEDIGKVKIPRWISQIAGKEILFAWASGAHYPKNLSEYAVIVHCGGCMLNRREMQYRIEKAREEGVFITNYGLLIAYAMGILPRALEPFPAAGLALANPE